MSSDIFMNFFSFLTKWSSLSACILAPIQLIIFFLHMETQTIEIWLKKFRFYLLILYTWKYFWQVWYLFGSCLFQTSTSPFHCNSGTGFCSKHPTDLLLLMRVGTNQYWPDNIMLSFSYIKSWLFKKNGTLLPWLQFILLVEWDHYNYFSAISYFAFATEMLLWQ